MKIEVGMYVRTNLRIITRLSRVLDLKRKNIF